MRKKSKLTYEVEKEALNATLQTVKEGGLNLDSRYQVKMPSALVTAIDDLYPDMSRSDFISRATADFLMRSLNYADDKDDLSVWKADEQNELDDLWDIMKELEGGKVMPIEDWVNFDPKDYE